jgi:hypothetical protein
MAPQPNGLFQPGDVVAAKLPARKLSAAKAGSSLKAAAKAKAAMKLKPA